MNQGSLVMVRGLGRLLTPHDAGRLIGGITPHNPRTTDHESGGLGLLTNQLYRPSCKSITPALCFGFAIDCGGGSGENIFPFLRSIPKKCHCGQAGAFAEGGSPDAGDTISNRDTRQAGAFAEGGSPDAGDTLRDRDARQASAPIEGILPDAGKLSGIVMVDRLAMLVTLSGIV